MEHQRPNIDPSIADFYERTPEEHRLERGGAAGAYGLWLAEAAGLEVDDVFGLEGPRWLFADIETRMENSRQRDDLLPVARHLEAEPAVLGLSAHLLLVGTRKD